MPAKRQTVFQILSRNVGEHGEIARVLHSTHDEQAHANALEKVRTVTATTPGLRPPTFGNVRPVKLLEIADPEKVRRLVNSAIFPSVPIIGTTWDSVKAAGLALGLSSVSLRQLFAQARKKNAGLDAPVTVRGLVLDYADDRHKSAD